MPRRKNNPDGTTTAVTMSQPPDYSLTSKQLCSYMFRIAMESGLFAKGKVSTDPFDENEAELLLLTHSKRRLVVTGLVDLAHEVIGVMDEEDSCCEEPALAVEATETA